MSSSSTTIFTSGASSSLTSLRRARSSPPPFPPFVSSLYSFYFGNSLVRTSKCITVRDRIAPRPSVSRRFSLRHIPPVLSSSSLLPFLISLSPPAPSSPFPLLSEVFSLSSAIYAHFVSSFPPIYWTHHHRRIHMRQGAYNVGMGVRLSCLSLPTSRVIMNLFWS